MKEYKYPKTTGYYCYCHITPDEMFYIGMSKKHPYDRWQPSHYKTTSLQPYIDKYGWENIRHVVLKDGLTDKQAEQLEGLLIEEAKRQGFCINEQGSGGRWRDNPKERQREYFREYRKTEKYKEYQREYEKTEKRKEYNREYQREYQREYNQRPEVKEYRREWQHEYSQHPEVKEHKREYQREYLQRPEVKERRREWQRQYRLRKKALKN